MQVLQKNVIKIEPNFPREQYKINKITSLAQ